MSELIFRVLARVTSNAYRVLGLPGNASLDDIVAAGKSLRRYLKLGSVKKTPFDLPWLGPLERSEASVRSATARLMDPSARTDERLFWFTEDNELLANLDRDSLASTAANWSSAPRRTACHDAAVLGLAAAVTTDPNLKDEASWLRVFHEWGSVVDSDDYWAALIDIEANGDFEPIATQEIYEVRGRTLELVTDIVASIARGAIAEGRLGTAQRTLQLLRKAGLPGRVSLSPEEELLAPLEAGFEALCKDIEDSCDRGIQTDDSHAAANAEICKQAVASFASEVQPALKNLLALSDKEGDLRFRARETASRCLHRIAIAHMWADKAEVARDFLAKAKKLAPSESAAAYRLESELEKATGMRIMALSAEIFVECGEGIVRDDDHAGRNRQPCRTARDRIDREFRPLLEEFLSGPELEPELVFEVMRSAAMCLFGVAMNHTWANRFVDAELLLLEASEFAPQGSEEALRISEVLPTIESNASMERKYGGALSGSPEHLCDGKRIFDVFVNATEGVRVPGVCTCCLAATTGEEAVSHSTSVAGGTRTMSLRFPLCPQCKKHRQTYRLKQALLVLCATASAVVLSVLIALAAPSASTPILSVGGATAPVALCFAWGLLLRLRPLGDKHASRGASVSIPGESAFRFWNPAYASAFAQANGSVLREGSILAKDARGFSLVSGRSAMQVLAVSVVLGLVGNFVLFGELETAKDRPRTRAAVPRPSVNSRRRPARATQPPGRTRPIPRPAPARSQPVPRWQETRLLTLSVEINAGRERIQALESSLKQIESRNKSLASQLETHKGTIKALERRAELGLPVSQSDYDRAIAQYNSLVPEYNRAMLDYKEAYSEYDSLFKKTNSLVEEYNRLVGH